MSMGQKQEASWEEQALPQTGSIQERKVVPQDGPAAKRRTMRTFTSKRTVHGVPLWQVGKNAQAVFAVGLKATGLVSVGLISTGAVSVGVLSVGVLSLGAVALGVISGGAVAVGAIAAGAVAAGMISFGALALGDFAVGASAHGDLGAMGHWANGMSAKTVDAKQMVDVCKSYQAAFPVADMAPVEELLKEQVPGYLRWAMKLFMRIIR